MQWGHYVKKQFRCICFDTETLMRDHPEIEDGGIHRLRLGVAKLCVDNGEELEVEETYRFTKEVQFQKWLINKLAKYDQLFLFAHNVGFDLRVVNFFRLFATGDLIFSIGGRSGLWIDDDPPTAIVCSGESGNKLTILDTLNFFRTKLADIGEKFGIRKMKMPPWKASDKKWFAYCERDVDVLVACVNGLIRFTMAEGLKRLPLTAPSLARASFDKMDGNHRIRIHHKEFVRRLERAAYFGGRVEAYRLGKIGGPIHKLDVNSMYPACMIDHAVPVKLVEHKFSCRSITPEIKRYPMEHIADVLIETDEPLFPVRRKNRLLFPIGKFWASLCGPELELAIRRDCVRSVRRIARYEVDDVFTNWMTQKTNARIAAKRSGDVVGDVFNKLLMVSLYGKYGQKTPSWIIREDMHAWEMFGYLSTSSADTKEEGTFRCVAGVVEEKVDECEHPQAFPAIAAYVTAYGRVMLLRMIEAAGWKNVYYVATDSLFVSQAGFNRLRRSGLIHDEKIGKLKLEDSAKFVRIDNVNDYSFGGKIKLGGVKQNAEKLGNNIYKQENWENLRVSLKRPPESGVRVTRIVKHLNREYKRGEIDDDGVVTPFVLAETKYDYPPETGRD